MRERDEPFEVLLERDLELLARDFDVLAPDFETLARDFDLVEREPELAEPPLRVDLALGDVLR